MNERAEAAFEKWWNKYYYNWEGDKSLAKDAFMAGWIAQIEAFDS